MRVIRYSNVFLAILITLTLSWSISSAQENSQIDETQRAALDDILIDIVDTGTEGIVVWVDTPNDQYAGSAGFASVADQTPMDINDSFRVASNTKTFVAATILLLQEEGLVDLDDLLSQYLPDVANSFQRGDQVTLRQLLNHTSGIYNYTNSPSDLIEFLSSEDDWTPQAIVDVAANRTYNSVFRPGQDWGYSNTNYVILGMVIAEVTNSTAEEQIRARILEPLDMESTYLDGFETPVGHLVDNHTMMDGSRGTFAYNTTSAYTAGAIVSNGPDLVKFARNVYTGEIFSQESSTKEMLSFLDIDDIGQFGYGLGMQRFYSDPLIYGHTGGWPGFISIVAYSPDIDTIVIVMVNSDYSMAGFNLMETTQAIYEIIGLEFPEIVVEEVDPLENLQPSENAVYTDGDTIVLPPVPPTISLGISPGDTLQSNARCFANTEITILRSGSIEGINYYEIDCLGMTGWVAADVIE